MTRSLRRVGLLCAGLVVVVPSALIAQPPPATVTAAGKEPALTFGGLVQVQGELGDQGDSRFPSSNDRIYLRRVRVNASGHFLEELDFKVELDGAGTLSNTTGLRAQLTDGYINWNRYPEANIRVGQFKAPFGWEQLSPDPNLVTLERSLATDRLTLARQLGVQVGGTVLDKRLSYALGAFNGTGQNDNFNDDSRFLAAGRLAGIPWRGKLGGQDASWSLGASAYRSDDTNVNLPDFGFDLTPTTSDKDANFAGKRRAWAADSQLVVGPFEIDGEFMRVRFEPTDRIPAASFDAEGYYVQATYFLIHDRLQAVVKDESFDPSQSRSNDDTRTATVGLNWYLKAQAIKLLGDYQRVDLPRAVAVSPGRKSTEDKVLLRMQVQF